MKVARGEKLDFIRALARELAQLSEADGLFALGYLFRMAEAETIEIKRSTKKPIAHSPSE